MINKKSQGLPINIVVMLIIGIIIFGLGMAMFVKMSSSGDKQIEELNSKIRTNIQSLQCDGEEWICAPNYIIENGNSQTFQIFLANRDEENQKYKVIFEDSPDGEMTLESDCGKMTLFYPSDLEVSIPSGNSASYPIIIKADQVSKTPCTFVKAIQLEKVGDLDFEQKTPIIIRVE
jgi:hypothetical protein